MNDHPTVIINAPHVYQLTRDRIEENQQLYQKYLGADPNADSDNYEEEEIPDLLEQDLTPMQRLKQIVTDIKSGKLVSKEKEQQM